MPLSAQQVVAPDGLQRWHRVALLVTGPDVSENDTLNPFLDYRMQVTFTHAASGTVYEVPGHFAADGQAAETPADSGDQWRAWLSPDHVGTWQWSVSFRTGSEVALSLDPAAGTAVVPFDGLSGSFDVLETDKTGRDHRARGRLAYVDAHHLRYADGTWFLKAGADSPENLLAYDDIDNTPNIGNRRKSWSPHAADWQPGDPSWQDGKGTELIGALNYLASMGLNAFSFLTYNHNGDDKNVYPHVDPNVRTRMDCSKLDQWEVVFAHGDRLGLYLHFKTQEQENDQDMDGGALGTERKLYYRELVSRFGHHFALNWNLGEENTNTTAQRIAFAQYIHDLDPYDHPIVVHTFPNAQNSVYGPLLGNQSVLAGPSIQTGANNVFASTLNWVQQSAASGRPWVCANDEQGNAQTGIKPDADDPTHDDVRASVLWGNILAGGAGIECYFGYAFAHSDLTCEDFRSRDVWWQQCAHALDFFRETRTPFWSMSNSDALTGDGHCLAGSEHFVVYLENGGSTTLDLSGVTGTFDVRWFDPRNGGALQSGNVAQVSGGGTQSLGTPPNATNADWVVLVRPDTFLSASVEDFGTGCTGTNGEPTIQAIGQPVLGNTGFGIRVASALAGASTTLQIGFLQSSVPIGGGCTLLVDTLASVPAVTDAGGGSAWTIAMPTSAAFLGSQVEFQAIVADPQGAFLGLAALTGGVEAIVGL